MRFNRLDFIMCNWPIWGIIPIVIAYGTHNFQDIPRFSIFISIVYGGGWLCAMGYGIYRLSQQKYQPKTIIFWVISLLWFSLFALPWLYWAHLRKSSK